MGITYITTIQNHLVSSWDLAYTYHHHIRAWGCKSEVNIRLNRNNEELCKKKKENVITYT